MPGGFKNKQEFGDELTAGELLWVQTGAAGILLLQEQSSSPSATANYGKVYVKTDKKLYYLNEDGLERDLSASVVIETPTGTVNSVNAVFTPTAEPQMVISDGIMYVAGGGYTWGGVTITMDIPPSQYIRVII